MKNRVLVLLIFSAAFSVGNLTQADTFDDAVNRYLQGFDYCSIAKTAINEGQLDKAQKALQQYESIKQDAATIDASILSDNRRGMSSNLKFCQRITDDLEIKNGEPILNNALDACQQVETALTNLDPDLASQYFQQFITLKNEALATSPILNDQFSTKNSIRRCERLERRIESFHEKQTQLNTSLSNVLEESKAFYDSCNAALERSQNAAPSKSNLAHIQKRESSAEAHKAQVGKESLALKYLSEKPDSPEKKTLDEYMTKGSRCMLLLKSTITQHTASLAAIEQELLDYNKSLQQSLNDCESVQKEPIENANNDQYEKAKSNYEKSLQTKNQVNAALEQNPYFNAKSGFTSVKTIKKTRSELTQCLELSRVHLSNIFNATPKIIPEFHANNTNKSGLIIDLAGVPSHQIQGKITMMEDTPELALIYMVDGTHPEQDVNVTIDSSGFEYNIYLVNSGDTFSIRNNDSVKHVFTANISKLGFSENLARLAPHQRKTSKVSWPENTIAEIRVEDTAIPATYMANIRSKNYQLIKFDLGATHLEFTLDNSDEAVTGFLLLPNYDPLQIDITKGDIKSLVLTQNKTPKGRVLLKGL